MKKVLVTGQSGYIGTKFREWIKKNNIDMELQYISVRDDSWKKVDFSNYDVILHLAGIAHVSRNKKLKEKYYDINTNLSVQLAKKAKRDGVCQFIFMSSIIVYGKQKNINLKTEPNPIDFYGDSKLKAEKIITNLETPNFKVAIVRPPMVYGEHSKGNFSKLRTLSKKTFFFPSVFNRRSMIFIDHLSEFLKIVILKEDRGVFLPQNKATVSTSNLVKIISEYNGNKVYFIKINNSVINFINNLIPMSSKIFGDLYYEQNTCVYNNIYSRYDLEKTIKLIEK